MNWLNLFKQRKPIIAFVLSIFVAINFEIGLTYGKITTLRTSLELLLLLFVVLTSRFPECVKIFFLI